MLPIPFVQVHISSQRVRLLRSSEDHIAFLEKQYPSRAKWLSMVCDILDVFLEILPCCHMTVLSSSWVSRFFEQLLSPRSCAGYPLTSWLNWTTTWRNERQKFYLTCSFLTGCLASLVLKQDSISSWICYLLPLIFILGYPQIELIDSQWGLNCVSLQEAHVGAINSWQL